ncbi:polyketide synthase [Apiospora aurea]|uniref:Polyketide synthase n=1 Tax=Apiospora aurea TaxID=335848 RepID=A0ABR1PXL7_9PEZI
MHDLGLVSRVSWTPASQSEDQVNFDKVVFLVPEDDETYNSEAVSAYQAQLADEKYATTVVSHITEQDTLLALPGSIIIHIPNDPSTKDGIYEAVHKSCARLVEAAQVLNKRQHQQPDKSPTPKLFSLAPQHPDSDGLAYAPFLG